MYRNKQTGELVFSPTDLTKFWESEFVAWMDHYALVHPDEFEKDDSDSMSKVLQAKGYEHEEATIIQLEAEGRKVFKIDPESKTAQQETIDAMKRGEEVIFQARLTNGPFRGWADFLVRVEGPSNLGDYHYEVWDTKLASELKPYYVIQLSAYAEMLESIQGMRAEHIEVVLGTGKHERLRLDDYYYYYLEVKQAFLEFHTNFDPKKRPDPEKYRNFGSWASEAQKMIEDQDALIQVAGLGMNQVKNLKAAGITTMTALSKTKKTKIPKMGEAVLARLKTQARLQIQTKNQGRPAFEIRRDNPKAGLYLLPKASEGDVFFDIEGFPVVQGGLEYLWGNTYLENGKKTFKDFWAHDTAQEKKAFEDFVDWIIERRKKYPDMHVYHYANYEISAMRKIMRREATREDEVDSLQRNNVFVDLYGVVKHGLFLGEPRYSIKNVELLYRGKRETEVTDGGVSIEYYNAWCQSPDGKTWEDSKILKDIRDYNIDDCDSTMELAEWLRAEQEKADIPPCPPREEKLPPKHYDENVDELQEALTAMIPKYPEAKLLLYLTDFYKREAKPGWWRFFDRLASLPEELYEDADCLAVLKAYDEAEKETPSRSRRVYEFDVDQECKLKAGDNCVHHHDDTIRVSVQDICYERGYVALTSNHEEGLPESMTLVPIDTFNHDTLGRAVNEYSRAWVENPEQPNAVRDFIHRLPPRIKNHSGGAIVPTDGDLIENVIEVVKCMENTTLCIQGPPGTGKTYTAEHVIAELVKNGKKVGITSNSHKAINNLLTRAFDRCKKAGISGTFVKVGKYDEEEINERSTIETPGSGSQVSITKNTSVIGGTAWCFASDNFKDQIDYLFVDEAGQMSIANLIAVARSCKNIIVMGDQMQLAQPIQGTHPGDSGASVLDYYLEDHATIPGDLGVFLPVTYRMHPNICGFISSAVYEDRLTSNPDCAKQKLDVSGSNYLDQEAGIKFIPVEHEGNTQAADEEVVVIMKLVKDLLGRSYTNSKGKKSKLTLEDILVVAPYNLQVRKLQDALGEEARVGSVDKFQGQEAPVVILSMCCSDAAASYRGIEFLFNKNRLNVAISRAQVAAIVVGHPGLVRTFAGSTEKVAQVNMFCRLVSR
jgi:uncharacterized protein